MSLFALFPATASVLAVAMLTCAISSTFNFVYDGCGQGTTVLPETKKKNKKKNTAAGRDLVISSMYDSSTFTKGKKESSISSPQEQNLVASHKTII